MLKSLKANQSSFKSVKFHPGFNVILAQRNDNVNDVSNTDAKGTRNGAGKTTLVELLHFCLGSKVTLNSIFNEAALKNWAFSLILDLDDSEYEITREVSEPKKIYLSSISNTIQSHDLHFPFKTDRNTKQKYLSPKDLTTSFLPLFYDVQTESDDSIGHLSFRELISYNLRREKGGFADPFISHDKSQPQQIQLSNAYLLGLNVNDVIDSICLKNQDKEIKDYKKLIKSSSISSLIANGSNSDINSLNHELEIKKENLTKCKTELSSFKIDEEYAAISTEADRLTSEIQKLTNDISINKKLLQKYKQVIDTEVNTNTSNSLSQIETLYNEAGVFFENKLHKELTEVMEFHQRLVNNRKSYLKIEIERIDDDIERFENQRSQIDEERSKLMQLLSSSGALEDYTNIQQRYTQLNSECNDIEKQIENLIKLNEKENEIETKQKILLKELHRDLNERKEAIAEKTTIFHNNSAKLYNDPASLHISVSDDGKYLFKITMPGIKSNGINNMNIFCYDLMLAEIGSKCNKYPNFLVHDSKVFDGVDERQKAAALELAYNKSRDYNFQYICILNSDAVPYDTFSPDFKETFDDSVILEISDSREDGGLLGIRF